MALEAATYINQLEPANPPGTDQLSQADDHLRLIKATLKATFPNITGPITVTQGAINSPAMNPVGMIGIWFGTASSVPATFAICDGRTVARTDGSGNITTPDLRNLVVMGAGSLAGAGTTFGAGLSTGTSTAVGGHTHTVAAATIGTLSGSTDDHVMTLAELASHTHGSGVVDDTGEMFNHGYKAGTSTRAITSDSGAGNKEALTDSQGGSAGHSHTVGAISGGSHAHGLATVGDHQHQTQVPVYQPAMALHYIMQV
jgi:hypothetical protein